MILEKALPLDKVAQYAQKLKNNILLLEKCDAKTSLELWFDMWKDGLIKSANKFPRRLRAKRFSGQKSLTGSCRISPDLRLYSIGLKPRRDSLMRFSRYRTK